MLFGAVTLQAWCFQALQQIACEKCGLKTVRRENSPHPASDIRPTPDNAG